MTTEEKFKAAVNVIKGLPKDGPYQPSNEMKLTFYGLYKQATEGPCSEPKPSFYQVVAGYKWNAWKTLGDMSKQKAMERYIVELKKIVETMSYSADVASFMETLGSFYEHVDVPAKLLDLQPSEGATEPHLQQQQQLLGSDSPLHSVNRGQPSDSAVSLEYVMPDKLSMPGTNGHQPPSDILQQVADCTDQVEQLKASLNSALCNGDVNWNGLVSQGCTQNPDSVPTGGACATCASGGEVVVPRPGRQAASSDTDSEDEYAVPPETFDTDGMMRVQGEPRHGGGDDVVLVLRQMQGDLQAMTQCLQAHLNDISQCLAALHRTNTVLQAHGEGGSGGNGGGAMTPGGGVVQQRRRRQWWPFPELSPCSTFWLLVWPVLLHAGLHAFKLALKVRLRRKK